jgi:hypothetical protein
VKVEETTLVKKGRVWVQGQRNKNIIWKNSTLTSQNVYYIPVTEDTILTGHRLSNLLYEPNATYSKCINGSHVML